MGYCLSVGFNLAFRHMLIIPTTISSVMLFEPAQPSNNVSTYLPKMRVLVRYWYPPRSLGAGVHQESGTSLR